MHSKISIGNDIVDLEDREPELHPRFIQRVFSPAERESHAGDKSALWLNWAAKEAAYKTLKRIKPSVIFAHAQFEFDRLNSCVTFGEIKLPCQQVINKEYVFVVCASSSDLLYSGTIYNWIEIIPEQQVIAPPASPDRASIDHSEVVRRLAINRISQTLNVPALDLEMVSAIESRTHSEWTAIPYLSIKGQITNHLLSFSHHGRFASCSFLSPSIGTPQQ